MQVPGGGPRDVTPPKAIHYLPDSAKVNFTGDEVRITFDENIVLKDIQNQLIVSPPMSISPEVTLIKNKIVRVKFKEPLKPNTTYGIYFGNAIADVHEGNAAEGFRYLFSTGSVLDSISMFGSVMDAFSDARWKQVTVMLYSGTDDSLPFKSMPDYFSRSGPDGSYKIQNIKPGKYKAVAIQDLNRNFRFDPEEELFGFSDSLIDLTTNRKCNFRLYAEAKRKQFVKRAALVEPGKVIIVLNKPCPDLKINVLNTQKTLTRLQWNKGFDTAYYFVENWKADSIQLLLVSDAELWKENVALRTVTTQKTTFMPRIIYSNGNIQDPDQPIRLLFNFPVDTFSFTGVVGGPEDLSTSDSSALEFTIQDNEVEIRPMAKSGKAMWEAGTDHTILLNPGCFTGFGGLMNDSIKLSFSVKELKFYGSLELKVQWRPAHAIVQLLNEKGQVVHAAEGDGELSIRKELLPPGKYRARIIYDENRNGKWDTGQYGKKIQPEKVIYSPGSFTVRSDWDVQEVWKVE